MHKVGLEGSLVRVFADQNNEEISFTIELDPRINRLDIEKIMQICPRNVYEITEDENAGLIK